MSDDVLGPRPEDPAFVVWAKKANYDEDVIFAILDEARLCHVAAVVNGKAMALPHTPRSRRSYLLSPRLSFERVAERAVVRAGEAFVTVTLLDGLRIARSAFETSIAYRSVVADRCRA